jgi:hypothetical protein
MIVSRDDPEGVIEMAAIGRGRPKMDGPEAEELLKRRMDVLALRRHGHTNPAIAEALGCSVGSVAGDVRWLRMNNYDIGLRPSGYPGPVERGEVALLRAASPADEAPVRAEVQERRVRGEDILSISIAMGIGAGEVRRHLQEAARLANVGDIEERRALQLARLDKMLLNLEEGVREGNPKAINAAVRVIAEGNRLQGLYAPVQVEHTVITLDMIESEMRRLTGELARAESLELTSYVDVDGEPVDE